jgi:hypothetical protein
MKNLQTFAEFINESKLNEALATAADLKDGAVTLADRYKEIADIVNDEPDYCDLKSVKKQYEIIAKQLRASEKDIMSIDSESDATDLVLAFHIGLDKRRKAGDSNIEVVSEFNFNSAWDSRGAKRNCVHYHVVDGKFDVITFMDGDDFADFTHLLYLKKDEKALLDWGNKNLSNRDTMY